MGRKKLGRVFKFIRLIGTSLIIFHEITVIVHGSLQFPCMKEINSNDAILVRGY